MPVYLSVHSHFYHPLRSQPLTGLLGSERSAAPFRNWNERLLEQVYRPNQALENFRALSLDFELDFLGWLQQQHPADYQQIMQSIHAARQQRGTNVMATPYHQSPLPLLSAQDRLAQLSWGRQAIQQHLGTVPQGVFLPDFAADHATLQSVLDAGFRYTVLRASQVEGMPRRGGAGPYAIQLPSGDSIHVFVVDDELSESMVEDLLERGGAGHWSRRELGPHLRFCGPLTLLYIEGDMLGTHKMGEAYFMQYLLTSECRALGYNPTSLEAYYQAHQEPVALLELLPTELSSADIQQVLRPALRDLMRLSEALIEEFAGTTLVSLRRHTLEARPPHAPLLQADLLLQRAWSQTNDLQHYFELAPRHVFHSVATALLLLHQATGSDLSAGFRTMLPGALQTEFAQVQGSLQSQHSEAQRALASTNSA